MLLRKPLAKGAAAVILGGALAVHAIPAAQAAALVYTQEVSTPQTCQMMRSATVDAFAASGYEIQGSGCLQGAGSYTLVIEYAQ